MHIEVETDGERATIDDTKSYACAPEACALCYRHSQLCVLRAVDAALAARMEALDDGDDAGAAQPSKKQRKAS